MARNSTSPPFSLWPYGPPTRSLYGAWEGTARLANADTHHYTNSCPQVHSFNDATWGDLEDWILSQERSPDSKGSCLQIPFLAADLLWRLRAVFRPRFLNVGFNVDHLAAGFQHSQSHGKPILLCWLVLGGNLYRLNVDRLAVGLNLDSLAIKVRNRA